MQRDDFQVKSFPGIDAVGLSERSSHLRVAIVTEEIIGPVRNGGIASTYYHLAKGLAARGHEVHVLFLKGPVVQDDTPEHWVRKYAEFGVRLHYLQWSEAPLWCAAPTWQRRYASAYEWLRDQDPFDVVHTSEWRGGLVYALMAKRLGLAFRDTLFVVKTSSPYIWNRHYQMQPVTDIGLVAAAYAEQKCVELADIVVGGSAHLISFMEHVGYQLPDANVYVQPNIVDFSNVSVIDRRQGPPRRHGDIVRSRDLVFFGRIEERKGVELFCNAIDLLHERGEIPDSVTFLGKWGAGLPAQDGLSPEAYVDGKAQTWACPVATETDKDQPAALAFLCESDVIAVMPSLIENSSMAVYETLEQRVPFIASDVGGTSELIAEADHEACLVEPTAQALADRMEHALRHGQVIARPRFSNDENLKIWYGFHAYIGELIERHGRTQAVARLTHGIDRPGAAVETVSYVALVRRGDSVDDLIKAFHAEAPDEVVLGYNDAGVRTGIEKAHAALVDAGVEVAVVSCRGDTAGRALDRLAASQTCDAMVIANGVRVLPQLGFFEAVREAISNRPRCLVTTFFATDDATVGMPLGGDVASQILTSCAYGPEVVALHRDTVTAIGHFEPCDARHGMVHEYMTRASEAGHDLLVFPEQLLSWQSAVEDARALRSDALYSYLNAKVLIENSDLTQRKLLLAVLHQAGRRRPGLDEGLLGGEFVDAEAKSNWLTPATWDLENVNAARRRRVIVGLDTEEDEIWLYARGHGERRLLVRGQAEPFELMASHGEEGTDDYLTLSVFKVSEEWATGLSYPVVFGMYEGDEKLRNTFFRINVVGAKTFVLSSRNPVVSAGVLTKLIEQHVATVADSAHPGYPAGPDAGTTDMVTASTEKYLDKAVAGALEFVKKRSDADPVRIVERSLELLTTLPRHGLVPVMPGSGLKPPRGKDGWVAGDWLLGWAWDREERDRILHVAVMRDSEPLLMVSADAVDRSLNEVPGRGMHAFRIPVLPEYFDGDRLNLEIWEGCAPVFRGGLFVDREGEPMLRRLRVNPTMVDNNDTSGKERRWMRRWIGKAFARTASTVRS